MDEQGKDSGGRVIDINTRADRYGLVDVAEKALACFETLRRTGELADQIDGTQLSTALLAIADQVGEQVKLLQQIKMFIEEHARRAFNRSSTTAPPRQKTP